MGSGLEPGQPDHPSLVRPDDVESASDRESACGSGLRRYCCAVRRWSAALEVSCAIAAPASVTPDCVPGIMGCALPWR